MHKIRFRHYINRWVQRNFGLRSKKLQIQTFLQPYFGPKEFTIGSESKVWKYDAAPTWDHFPAKFQQCLLVPVWDTNIQPWVQSWVPKISVHNVVFSFGPQVSWTWTQKVTPPYVVASLHFVQCTKSNQAITSNVGSLRSCICEMYRSYRIESWHKSQGLVKAPSVKGTRSWVGAIRNLVSSNLEVPSLKCGHAQCEISRGVWY